MGRPDAWASVLKRRPIPHTMPSVLPLRRLHLPSLGGKQRGPFRPPRPRHTTHGRKSQLVGTTPRCRFPMLQTRRPHSAYRDSPSPATQGAFWRTGASSMVPIGGTTESDGSVDRIALLRRLHVAERRAQIGPVFIPGPATHDPLTAARRAVQITFDVKRGDRIRCVPAGGPLPYVTVHVENAQRIRRAATDGPGGIGETAVRLLF